MTAFENQVIYQKLYPKQKEALNFLNNRKNSKLALLATGCGKTICALSWIENKIKNNQNLNNVFLVAPSCKLLDWKLEFKQWQIKGVFTEYQIVELNKSKTNLDTILANQSKKTIFIISHTMFRMLEEYKKLVSFKSIWNPNITLVAVDEASIFKNTTSSISKMMWFVSKLMNHSNCIYLTATILSNHKFDVYQLLKLTGLDFGYGDNLYMDGQAFKDYFLNFKVQKMYNPFKHQQYEIKTEIGLKPEKEKEFFDLIHLNGYTLTLEELKSEIPLINNSVRYVENKDYQSKSIILKRMMTEAIKSEYDSDSYPQTIKEFEPLNFVTPTNCLMYERQLCSGFISNNQIKDFKSLKFENPKLEQLKSLLENTKDNAIVFYNFQQECEDIKAMIKKDLPDKKIIIVNGNTPFSKSKDIIDSIKTQSENYVLIGQVQACGLGINLQLFSHLTVYFSLPLSYELFEQSKGRINRIGQSSPCFYYYLIVKDSVEEKIYKTLLLNQSYSQKIYETENGI